MRKSLISTVLVLLLSGLAAALCAQTTAAKKEPAKQSEAKKATPAGAPSQADIDAAKAKGMVWVNLNSGIYHKSGEFYGKTKSGKFMTEDEAKKAGYRAAKEGAAKKATGKMGKMDATKK
jgi:hypothetical protein